MKLQLHHLVYIKAMVTAKTRNWLSVKIQNTCNVRIRINPGGGGAGGWGGGLITC